MNDETLEQLLTEDEIRRKMSVIHRRYSSERQALRDAFDGLSRAKAEAHVATMFLEPEMFKDENAKAFLAKAKAKGLKLIKEDKESLVILEMEARQTAYDLAKFDCETSDKEFAQLDKQLTFYQSIMKFAGTPVPLEETASWG